MIKETRIYKGENAMSSTNVVGKAGQPHENQWNLSIPSYHIQKLT